MGSGQATRTVPRRGCTASFFSFSRFQRRSAEVETTGTPRVPATCAGSTSLSRPCTSSLMFRQSVNGTSCSASCSAGQPRLVVDTPGTNGLTPHSDDERVARDMLLRSPDADVLQVGDTGNLRRTLLLSWSQRHHRGRPNLDGCVPS